MSGVIVAWSQNLLTIKTTAVPVWNMKYMLNIQNHSSMHEIRTKSELVDSDFLPKPQWLLIVIGCSMFFERYEANFGLLFI